MTSFAAAPAARADIISEGTKWVDARVVISAGPYAEWCEQSHLVAAGETIESIARSAYGDEARAAEVRRCNALPADGQPKAGTRLVLPAKSAEPADTREPHAWEFWIVSGYGPLEESMQLRPGHDIKGPHQPFTLLALPVARSADFAKLLREKAKASFDGKWETELPWLVVSRNHSCGKVVEEGSTAVRGLATCTFDEVKPAPLNDKRWTFTRTHEYFDRDGKPVEGWKSGGFIDVSRAWPLIALSCFGALLLGVLRRRRAEPRQWRWLAPAVASLLLAPAARADVLIEGTKSIESSARVVVDESATAKGAPAWELWRFGDDLPLQSARRIAAGEELRRDSSFGFRVLAVAADHAADFEALRAEKGQVRIEEPWESPFDWLVVSGSIDLPRSVDEASPVERIETTYELRAVDPARGGKRWKFVAADVEEFDGSGVALSQAQMAVGWGGRSIVPLGLVALVGALWAWRRSRPGTRAA